MFILFFSYSSLLLADFSFIVSESDESFLWLFLSFYDEMTFLKREIFLCFFGFISVLVKLEEQRSKV